MAKPYLYDSLGHQMEWRPNPDPITVHNVHGCIDNVHGVVDPSGFGCRIRLAEGDDRFMCGECGTPVHKVYPRNAMYVDSQGIVWCPQCYSSCVEGTVRSMKKAEQDPAPKIYHQGGNYYQRLKRRKQA